MKKLVLLVLLMPSLAFADCDISILGNRVSENAGTLATIFVPSCSGTISTIVADMAVETMAGVATVSLYANSGGLPTGSSLGDSNTFVPGGTYSSTTITWATPLNVTSGTSYHFVLTDNGAGSAGWKYTDSNSGASYNDGTWNAFGDRGFRFSGTVVESVGGGSASSTVPLLRMETITSITYVIAFAMLLYLLIKAFTPRKRQRI